MKKINILLMCLCNLFLFTGCYTNEFGEKEFGDNGEPDVSKEIDIETLINIHNGVDKFFSESATIDEMAKHLDEIKAMNGVAEAWTTDNALHVKTNNGISNTWLYTTDFQVDIEALSKTVKQATRSTSAKNPADHAQLSPQSVVIINQGSSDESRKVIIPQIDALMEGFSYAGFKVEYINQPNASVFFLQENLTSYDIIFLITHGCYDGLENNKNAKHWIVTGTELNKEQFNILDSLCKNNVNYSNQVGYSTIKEIRNGIESKIKYLKISEDFIKSKNMKGEFNDAIIFNVACQSLKDGDALAEAFFTKGAKTYLGYDESNCQGVNAGCCFFTNMLFGMNVDRAFKKLEEEHYVYVHDNDGRKGHPNANLKIVGDKNVCIIHPLVEATEPGEITSTTVELNGKMTEWRETLDKENSKVGFCWSSTDKEPKMNYKNSEGSCEEFVDSYNIDKDGTCNFKGKMEGLSPNTTYYYRPFLYMNNEYYYGDVKELKTKEEEKKEDDDIRKYLEKLYKDTDGDNWSRKDNWLSNKPVNDWYGVSFSEGKLSIALFFNKLKGNIDLSGCTALTELSCSRNNLTDINVSGCSALTYLSCELNNMTSLNVSGCTALERLYCSNNNMTGLNVSGCTSLTMFSCSDNNLTSLNASGCTALKSLSCTDKNLTGSLDVSGCTALKFLSCTYKNLKNINVSGCSALEKLYCSNNNLTSLDVSDCIMLESLNCRCNNLKSLKVLGCTALKYLDCENNYIKSVIPPDFRRLNYFYHDCLYNYNSDECTYTTNKYGWYYPGEPESMKHDWPSSDAPRRQIKKK